MLPSCHGLGSLSSFTGTLKIWVPGMEWVLVAIPALKAELNPFQCRFVPKLKLTQPTVHIVFRIGPLENGRKCGSYIYSHRVLPVIYNQNNWNQRVVKPVTL